MESFIDRLNVLFEQLQATPLVKSKANDPKSIAEFRDILNRASPIGGRETSAAETLTAISNRNWKAWLKFAIDANLPGSVLLLDGAAITNALNIRDTVFIIKRETHWDVNVRGERSPVDAPATAAEPARSQSWAQKAAAGLPRPVEPAQHGNFPRMDPRERAPRDRPYASTHKPKTEHTAPRPRGRRGERRHQRDEHHDARPTADGIPALSTAECMRLMRKPVAVAPVEPVAELNAPATAVAPATLAEPAAPVLAEHKEPAAEITSVLEPESARSAGPLSSKKSWFEASEEELGESH